MWYNYPMSWLNGKTVLISGISSGIGKEFAKRLISDYDCTVYGIARNQEKITKLKVELGEKSSLFKDFFLFDVAIEDNWKNLAETLKSREIGIDVVINCAGILPPFKKFILSDKEMMKRVFDVDYFSCVYSVKYMLPIVEKSETPAIINVSSSAALATFAGISGYSAAKAALKQFTLSLAEEYRNKVYFGCICPGFTKTNILTNQQIKEKERKFIDKISSSVEKIVEKSLKRIKRKKRLSVIGYDAKLMNFFYKIMPITTAKIITQILKKSKFDLFSEI